MLAPGGGYMFGFDKGLFSLDEPIAENVRALAEFVLEYGKY